MTEAKVTWGKQLKWLVGGAAAGVALFAGGLLILAEGCERFESPRMRYASFAEMERDGGQERGWVPSYLPESSFDIYEAHNIDSNLRALSFSAPLADVRMMVASMRPIAADGAARCLELIDRRRLWTEPLDRVQELATRNELEFFRARAEGSPEHCVAVAWEAVTGGIRPAGSHRVTGGVTSTMFDSSVEIPIRGGIGPRPPRNGKESNIEDVTPRGGR